jgi:hypothetical protein
MVSIYTYLKRCDVITEFLPFYGTVQGCLASFGGLGWRVAGAPLIGLNSEHRRLNSELRRLNSECPMLNSASVILNSLFGKNSQRGQKGISVREVLAIGDWLQQQQEQQQQQQQRQASTNLLTHEPASINTRATHRLGLGLTVIHQIQELPSNFKYYRILRHGCLASNRPLTLLRAVCRCSLPLLPFRP